MKSILLVAGSLLLTAIFVPGLAAIAPRLGLLDHPGGRKNHERSVPLVGGLAIFLTVCVALAFQAWSPWHAAFLVALSIIAGCGVLDDRHELRSATRLILQSLAALAMTWIAGIELHTVGDLLGTGGIGVWLFSTPITIFAVCGVVNAFNMADGSDGACGTLALIALVFYAWAARLCGLMLQLEFLLVLAGAVAGFLMYNLRLPWQHHAKVFLGDTGSTLLGFALAWFAIDLTQGPGKVLTPISALWVVVIPLCDTVSLMIRRIAAKSSPFSPDRQHLHHLLLGLGLSPMQVVAVLALLGISSKLVGIGGWQLGVPEPVLFAVFVLCFLGYHWAVSVFWRRRALFVLP